MKKNKHYIELFARGARPTPAVSARCPLPPPPSPSQRLRPGMLKFIRNTKTNVDRYMTVEKSAKEVGRDSAARSTKSVRKPSRSKYNHYYIFLIVIVLVVLLLAIGAGVAIYIIVFMDTPVIYPDDVCAAKYGRCAYFPGQYVNCSETIHMCATVKILARGNVHSLSNYQDFKSQIGDVIDARSFELEFAVRSPAQLPIELGDSVPCVHSRTTSNVVVPGLCRSNKCVRADKNDKLNLFVARLATARPAQWSEWGTSSLFQECVKFGEKSLDKLVLPSAFPTSCDNSSQCSRFTVKFRSCNHPLPAFGSQSCFLLESSKNTLVQLNETDYPILLYPCPICNKPKPTATTQPCFNNNTVVKVRSSDMKDTWLWSENNTNEFSECDRSSGGKGICFVGSCLNRTAK